MIGIYKITKISNGKFYIGQSVDINRRFSEYKYPDKNSKCTIDAAIRKYGKDNFTYEVIEECSIDELDEKEKYWIEFYNTYDGFGYNANPGEGIFAGENNGRAKLTEKDVVEIRKAYNQHRNRKEVYEKYKDIISFHSFASVWDGSSWSHIMPKVFTEENKNYYMYQATNGELSSNAILSDDEVLKLRYEYVDKSAKILYNDYKDRIKYQTFQAILWERTYKHLPIYKKKEKRWVNND